MAKAGSYTNAIHEKGGYTLAQKATVISRCVCCIPTPIIRKSAISVFAAQALFTAERLKNKCNACHRVVPHSPPFPHSSLRLFHFTLAMLGPGDRIWGETYLHGVTTVITALYFSKWRETHINTSVSYNSVLD